MSIAYNSKIVTSGLVLCLDAANSKSYPGSGTAWNDLSGNGNNSTLTNGPTYNSANNGSIVFDGVNDYAVAARPASIVTGGSISVCLWAKWVTTGTTASTIQALVDNRHSASPKQGFVLQDRPDLSQKLTWTVSPLVANSVVSTTKVGDGNWHHIVGTNDGTTSILYIDGKYDASYAEPGLATVQPNIAVGYWQYTPGRYLNGAVSNLRIYDRALTAAEVKQNFEALRGRYGI